MRFSVFPTVKSSESEQWGHERSRVYHSFFRAQARSCTSLFILLASDSRRKQPANPSSNTRKHALTIFFIFISMMPLPGGSVEMLGASQFVNVVLFQFSGPSASLSAQTSLRSVSRDSSILSFSSSCPPRPQVDFCSAREKTYASPRGDGGGQPASNPGEEAADCRAAVLFTG